MGIIVGKVKDYSSHQIIQGAKITFPGTSIEGVVTSSAGIYKKEVPPGTYEIKVEKEGYVPDGGVVVVEAGETVTKDFELFKKEEKIILRGINFEFNSAVIKPSSYPVLDEAVELLKKHPKVIVEIGGHTDAVGSDAYNLKLSKLRAESVKKYLVRKGIDPSRLRTRGYGETMPIADNSTPAGRELNRRIEFKILSK
jgi:outer membrane protein OmpA-like peptidoglycan-associated protein